MRLLSPLLLCACSGATLGLSLPDPFPGDTDTPPEETDVPDDTDIPGPATTLVLNEVLASNDTVNTDENGEFDDWVELYNPTEEDIVLDGWVLEDAESEHELPSSAVVPAGGLLLIWCDGSPEQGPLHAPFSLSRSAETVTLTGPDGTLVDQLAWGAADSGFLLFGEQTTDVSLARLPDGGAWLEDDSPTPGASNDGP